MTADAKPRKISLLGSGAWALTLADLLASKGHDVQLWGRNRDALDRLARERLCEKPAGLRIRDSVEFQHDFDAAVSHGQFIISVVPSFALREICRRLSDSPAGLGERVFVNCSKGIEEGTLLFPSGIFADFFPGQTRQFAILSGPSIAAEVCQGIPTVVTCCAGDADIARAVQEVFFLPNFRVYRHDDCRGAELGGALKNVIAVAAGICDGLGFGHNTKSAIITRGLAEIARMGAEIGARPETLSGLAGLGDLVTTCTSPHSRNRTFGELLGKGVASGEALRQVGAVVEGYLTSKAAHELGQKLGIEMPITAAVHAVLHEKMSIRDAANALIQRPSKPEIY